jgi:hypothetical protein
MSKNNPTNPASLSNSVVHVGTGDINLSNYLEPVGHTPCDDLDSEVLVDNSYIPLPHQDQSDEATDSAPNSPILVNAKPAPPAPKLKSQPKKDTQPVTTGPYQVPLSLRKQFKIPFKAAAPVVTPNSKATLSSANPKQAEPFSHVGNTTNKNQTPTTSSKKTATNDTDKVNQKPLRESTHPLLNDKDSFTDNDSDSSEDFNIENSNAATKRFLPNRELFDIYDSPYLNKMFKPTLESLNLAQELEPLAQLFLSQHETLVNPIKDLINTNLTLTKILEKKKESSRLLYEHKKIPRSLRIKCELTTSPSYSSNPVFLKLKDDLKNEVSTFITQGTKILAEWSDTYIKLLTIDRCTDIMKQAIKILDCLTTFYVGAIGTPLWPSVDDKYLTLFLLKAYLSDTFCETEDLSNFFNLPINDILYIGAQFLLKSDNNEEITKTLLSLKLSDIDMEEHIDSFFITEIFLNFDQILKVSTLGAWHLHSEQNKQALAAANMKSKLKSLQTISASHATALAITKATETFNNQQSLNANTNLRISNLERDSARHEHKSNNIINFLKKSQQKGKNYQGSHFAESMTSPETQTLSGQHQKQAKRLKRNLIDLTTEETIEISNTKKPHLAISQPIKGKRNQRKSRGQSKNPQATTRKSIQWKDTETIHQFHPQYPVASPFVQHTPANPFTMQSDAPKPPLFPPPPPPQITLHPIYTQSSFQPQIGHQHSFASQTLPNQQAHPNPFQSYFQPTNPFTNFVHNQAFSDRKNPFQKQWNPFNKSN